MAENFASRYYRGQGKLFLGDRDANGNPVGLVFIGDLSSAEMTPQIERDQVIENVTGSGGIGASWLRSSQFNMQLTMRSIRKEHLEAALHGTALTKVSGSITAEAHTVKLGKFSRLQHTNVSTVVVKASPGGTTISAANNYVVYPAEGMIEWLAGGTVTDAQNVTIDYGYAAQYHVPSAPNNVAKYLVFAGKNTADSDKQTRCEIYRCKLDPGVLSLITESAGEIPMSGVVELDSLRAAGDQFFSWKVEQ